jgi:hypothetical protein
MVHLVRNIILGGVLIIRWPRGGVEPRLSEQNTKPLAAPDMANHKPFRLKRRAFGLSNGANARSNHAERVILASLSVVSERAVDEQIGAEAVRGITRLNLTGGIVD